METKSLNLADSLYAEVSKLKDEKSLKEVLGMVELMKWTAEKALKKATAYKVIKVRNMELDADGNINITPSYDRKSDDYEADWVSGMKTETTRLFNYRLARKILSTVIGRINRKQIDFLEDGYVGDISKVESDVRTYGEWDKYGDHKHYTYSFEARVMYQWGYASVFIEELEKELDKYDFSRWIDFEIEWDGHKWSEVIVKFNGITNDTTPITIRENK